MATKKTTYRYDGPKSDRDGSTRLIVEGTSSNPKRWADVGGKIDLTADEAESLKTRHRLVKSSGEASHAPGEQPVDETPSALKAPEGTSEALVASNPNKPSGSAGAVTEKEV